MQNSYYNAMSQRKITSILKFFGAIVILIIVVVTLFSIQTSSSPTITKLPIGHDVSADLNDNEVVSFNGVSFAKYDLNTNKSTVLLSGSLWPKFGSINWAGDSGAFVTVNGSIYATPFEQFADQYDLYSYSNDDLANNFLWYIDFTSGSVRLISNQTVLERSYYYDAKTESAYFSEVAEAESEGGEPSLRTVLKKYTVRDMSLTSTLTVPLTSNISINPCGETQLCVYGEKLDGVYELGLVSDTAYTAKKTVVGRVVTSSTPDIFYLLTALSSNDEMQLSEDSAGIVGNYSVSQYILSTNNEMKLPITIDSLDQIVAFPNGESHIFTKLGATGTETINRSKTLLGITRTTTKENVGLSPTFMSKFVETPEGRGLLVHDITGDYYYIGSGDVKIAQSTAVESTITSCTNTYGLGLVNNSGSYIVRFVESGSTQSDISAFSTCVNKTPETSLQASLDIILSAYTDGPALNI